MFFIIVGYGLGDGVYVVDGVFLCIFFVVYFVEYMV